MNTQQVHEQRLRRYLLGMLPAAEVEELDERSFLDDTFAAQLQSVEDNLIDDYVHGELAAAEVGPFNTYFLATPRRREKVNFAQSLQSFTARAYPALLTPTIAVAEPTAGPATPTVNSAVETSPPWWRSLLDLFAVPSFALQTGLAAATVILFAGGAWLAWEAWRLRGQFDQLQTERTALTQRAQELQQQLAQQQDIGTQEAEWLRTELQRMQEQLAQLERERTLALQQARPELTGEIPDVFSATLRGETRAGGTKPTLTIPAATDYIKLRLSLGPEDYPRFRVVLNMSGSNQSLWQSKLLKVTTQGDERWLVIAMPARLLLAGEYNIITFGLPAGRAAEEVRNYSFTIVRQ